MPLVCLAALGVVFGDIGTSPLYALRECFSGTHMEPTPGNVLGVLSLIFWALMIVVSAKYLLYVIRADNKGEGGILALLALIRQRDGATRWVVLSGVFGAALLYGDGMITPAISVLSAVEGLEVATPYFKPLTIPVTVAILILLFAFQRHGTTRIGLIFGPIMLLWFGTLALLGVRGILNHPEVLAACNPWYAALFFRENGGTGFAVLGAVFLVVTGGEALYADLGHFGRRPIRIMWFALTLPALLLNYFGQGALVLSRPSEIVHPFFHLAPDWGLYPLVLLSTVATVIASQAMISGAFSLTRQAAQLDEFPRVEIRQTSSAEIGQIYVPIINWMLMLAAIGLVLGFKSSANLASAYGVAVSSTMLITTVLAGIVARKCWRWKLWPVFLITATFLAIDLAFFGANMLKFVHGGWFPLLIGGGIFAIMTTWRSGRDSLHRVVKERELPLDQFLDSLALDPPVRVPGTAVFMTGRQTGTPLVLLHHLKFNKALAERVMLLHVRTLNEPHAPPEERLNVEELRDGFWNIHIAFGFMDQPDVPEALRAFNPPGRKFDLAQAVFYVGKLTLLPCRRMRGLAQWRKSLFAFLTRNATQPVIFFNIPPRQVVEMGMQIEI